MKKKHLLSDIVSAKILFLVVALCFFVAWRSYNLQVSDGRESQVQLMGDLVKDRFSLITEQNIFTLKNLADRIHKTEGDYFQFWKSDAEFILAQNPSFKFIEFIDSNMIVQDIYPLEGNGPVVGLDISTIDYRKPSWILNTQRNQTNITPWVQLKQGAEAFLVDEPLYINGVFWGTMTAGLDFRKQVDQIFEDRTGFHMHLFDQKEYQFYCSNLDKCTPIEGDSALV